MNDVQPFWLGNDVFFISDRHEKRLNLHRFEPESGDVERLTDQTDWDIHWADGHGNTPQSGHRPGMKSPGLKSL